jgi:prepilin-type N-terminal cleavage/methylation domain-containing protein
MRQPASRTGAGATAPRAVPAPRRGFTLIELMLALIIALVVITAATAFSVTTWESRRSWTLREGIDRGARFIGMALNRDAQEAGVALESTPVFASVGSFGDTLSILSVPFEPNEAPVYPIWNDGDTLPNYPPGGNCGTTCIRFNKVNGTFRLAAGDLARLQVGPERRLLYLTSVADGAAGTFQVEFLPMTELLGRPAGLDSLLLARSGTSLQKLKFAAYWRDGGTKSLMRAERLGAGAALVGQPMTGGVEDFTTSLFFTNGVEAPEYNGFDADTTNDGNRIMGIKVRARLQADRTDPAVNNGQPVYRWYEWRVAPRNLLYEKNRM